MSMKAIKIVITIITLCLCANSFAQTKQLLIKAHHPNDKNTTIRIWKTFENNYIIRTNYGKDENDFDQEKLYQHQKRVEYDGFAKRVILKTSDETFYVLAHIDGQYAFVYGFYSDALDKIVSVAYIIDYIDEKLFKNL